MKKYSSMDDAVFSEVIVPLEACGEFEDDYDIDSIVDEVIGYSDGSYYCIVDSDTFWGIVSSHYWSMKE